MVKTILILAFVVMMQHDSIGPSAPFQQSQMPAKAIGPSSFK